MIIATCPIEFYDAVNMTCSNVVFNQQMGLFPSLSVQDGFLISSAIAGIWATGLGFKMLRKYLFR